MTTPRIRRAAAPTAAAAPSRVPEPTAGFWAAKAASTALGEALSDFSIRIMPAEIAVVLGFVLFVAALGLQLTRRRYVPEVYWLAVAAVGVFGTMAADDVRDVGLPYLVSTTLYAAFLATVFLLWWRSERTLSVHSITTTRREVFYWAVVVGTFALGTALGDLGAVGLGWGYLPSVGLFLVLILVPGAGYRWGRWNGVAAFWIAYVLTRPLGASVADWLGKPTSEGGVGIGSGWVSLGFLVAMLAVVAVMRSTLRRSAADGHESGIR